MDEVADSGASLIQALGHVKEIGAKETRTAVLILKSTSKIIPDYWIQKIDKWIVYPWEHRESILSLVKKFQTDDPTLDMTQIREKLVFEVGFQPTTVDYFIKSL